MLFVCLNFHAVVGCAWLWAWMMEEISVHTCGPMQLESLSGPRFQSSSAKFRKPLDQRELKGCVNLRGMNLPIFLLLVFELLLSKFLFRNPCHRNSCRLLRNLEMGLPCLQSSKLRSSHLCKLRNRQAPNCKLGNSHTLKLIHLRLPPI